MPMRETRTGVYVMSRSAKLTNLSFGALADLLLELRRRGLVARKGGKCLSRVIEGLDLVAGGEIAVRQAVERVRGSGVCVDVQFEDADGVGHPPALEQLVADRVQHPFRRERER